MSLSDSCSDGHISSARRPLGRPRTLTLMLSCAVLASCGGSEGSDTTPTTPPPVAGSAPTITSFAASPASINAGGSSTLSWAQGEGPGTGERPVTVVLDADVPKLERLAIGLLKAPTPPH